MPSRRHRFATLTNRPIHARWLVKTLLDVIRFYNKAGVKNPMLDEKMTPLDLSESDTPLDLSESEMNYLVEFLRALTSDDVLRWFNQPSPNARCVTAELASGVTTFAVRDRLLNLGSVAHHRARTIDRDLTSHNSDRPSKQYAREAIVELLL